VIAPGTRIAGSCGADLEVGDRAQRRSEAPVGLLLPRPDAAEGAVLSARGRAVKWATSVWRVDGRIAERWAIRDDLAMHLYPGALRTRREARGHLRDGRR
jgi:hypothetical protein